MRPGIMAARSAIALERTAVAVAVLADRFDLPEHVETLRAAAHRDPDVAAVFQREAIANLAEALVGATEPAAPKQADADAPTKPATPAVKPAATKTAPTKPGAR